MGIMNRASTTVPNRVKIGDNEKKKSGSLGRICSCWRIQSLNI